MRYTLVWLICAVLLGITCYAQARIQRPEYCGPTVAFPAPPVTASGQAMTLKQVQVVFRHGDRTPIKPCWDGAAEWTCSLREEYRWNPDPSFRIVPRLHRKNYIKGKNVLSGNCASGDLTEIGAKQHELNGALFRKAYVEQLNFLPPTFNSNIVSLRSTDVPRTLASLGAFLQGLYPLMPNQEAEVLHVNTVDKSEDYLTPNSDFCPVLKKFNKEWQQSEMYKSHFNNQTMQLVRDLNAAFNTSAITAENAASIIGTLFDCLNAHLCHGFEIPPAITQSLFDRIVEENTWLYGASYSYPSRKIYGLYGIGALVSDILNNFAAAVANSTQLSLAIFSGHDTTIMPLLSAFEVWDNVWPPYASTVVFELWQSPASGSAYYVRLLYNNKVLHIPGCDTPVCEFDVFASIAQKIALPARSACFSGEKHIPFKLLI